MAEHSGMFSYIFTQPEIALFGVASRKIAVKLTLTNLRVTLYDTRESLARDFPIRWRQNL